ncbi:RNA-binding protein 42 [Aphidius gifuensis]|uniref:RNA-binding protein 42 n=1 Tax=Aphidius gifuensis TaxID=684658 RepID=UPI001CDB5065|nr:RNA-binding protein 42 [Aphidius gifuensis]XP_044017544.1 RNA-binding protein 42 [Aphidius gifuensis]
MEDKLRQMEDEMSRFEAEISGQTSMMRPVIGVNTYSQVARQLEQHDIPAPAVAAAAASLAFPPMMGFPPPPPPPPMLIPPQVNRPVTTYSSPAQISNNYVPAQRDPVTRNQKTYEAPTVAAPVIRPDIIEKIINTKIPEDDGKKKIKVKGVSTAAELAISQGKASSVMANASVEESHSGKGKGKKSKKIIRMAGGQTWEDPSLLEWDDDDFRIFCGDLGNDVTDEMLVRVFSKYSSFKKAKVVRDKRTNKTKGFGFVSFKDPQDFIKAMKEMNGRYVGSRPIKLRKSSWKQRNLDSVRKKEKEKQTLIGLLTGQ